MQAPPDSIQDARCGLVVYTELSMPSDDKKPAAFAGRLTERSYWDTVHQGSPESAPSPDRNRPKRSAGLRRLVPPLLLHWLRDSFAQEDFWNRLLPRYVARDPGGKVLEIGVAPGHEVLRFQARFGHEPFGIEFSPAGAETTRRNFAAHGIRVSNVIEGDVFDRALLAQYESKFDVVFSRGFIEHFADPTEVIANHVHLAKPGGLIVISIPRLTGFHYLLTRVLMPHQIAVHNLSIMWLEPFRQLFDPAGMEPLFCGYQGGPNFLVSYTDNPSGLRAVMQWWTFKMQGLANLAGWASDGRLMRGAYFEASLLFIGRKRI